jgi:hypothetical protein
MHEECGVFALYGNGFVEHPAEYAYLALYAMQHRGQQSCGIAVNNEGKIYNHNDEGLLNEVFNEMILNYLKGNIALGHVRYASADNKGRENNLPYVSKYTKGQLIVTDGKNGSWALTDEGVIHQDIVKEKQAVDSTGCGDAFHAGYGIGILEGWDLKTRMECGAWLASIVITKLGGRTALPFKKDIPKLVGKNISKNLREKLLKIAKRK